VRSIKARSSVQSMPRQRTWTHPRFICEAAKEHNGSTEKARQIIKEAAELGFWAVKFQAYDLKDLNKNHKNYERYKKCYLGIEQLRELSIYARENKINFYCSCFSTSLVRPLSTFTNIIKVPSTYFGHGDFVRDCVFYFPSIHFSTGFHDTEHVHDLIESYNKMAPTREKIYYHCTSIYPTPNDKNRLSRIGNIGMKGFSYHGNDTNSILSTIVLGVEYVELHYTIEKECKDWQWNKELIQYLFKKVDHLIESFKDVPITEQEKKDFALYCREYDTLKSLRNV
jgi:sialic acid synthase SpsE